MNENEEFADIELTETTLMSVAGGRNDGKRLAC